MCQIIGFQRIGHVSIANSAFRQRNCKITVLKGWIRSQNQYGGSSAVTLCDFNARYRPKNISLISNSMNILAITGSCKKCRHKVSRSVYTEVKSRVSDPFSFYTDPDPAFQAEYRSRFFWDQKLQFTYPQASIKDFQVTEEAFSFRKRTSSILKHEIS